MKAICERCGAAAIVYDLTFYPAATKQKGAETFSEMDATKVGALAVYVGYEYGEFDEDQEIDENDITWCQVFVELDGELCQVFDDETA